MGLRLPSTTAATAPAPAPSARRACGWLLGWWKHRPGREEEKRTTAFRRRFVAALCRFDAHVAEARRLGQEFLGLLAKQRNGQKFDC